MSHALKSKPQPDAQSKRACNSVRMSLASIPPLTKEGKAKLQRAARKPGRGQFPELPEWQSSSLK
jgi:hypothetical protein